jgi:hypothetical protein
MDTHTHTHTQTHSHTHTHSEIEAINGQEKHWGRLEKERRCKCGKMEREAVSI